MLLDFIPLLALLVCSLFTVAHSEVGLLKSDALADLSALAMKYFSESPDVPFDQPDSKVLTALAWSLSDLWEESGSTLYLLSRLAKLVDEKAENGADGLSIAAKAIRTLAKQSEARKAHMPTVADVESSEITKDSNLKMQSKLSPKNNVESVIESLYRDGKTDEADYKVKDLINGTWTSSKKVLESIENAARKQQFNLLSALVKFGEKHEQLLYISPEDKARMLLILYSLEKFTLSPKAAKWLLTMDTFREDQMKLVNIVEADLNLKSYKPARDNRVPSTVAQVIDGVISIEKAANMMNENASPSFNPDQLLKKLNAVQNKEAISEVKAAEDVTQVQNIEAADSPNNLLDPINPEDPDYFKKEEEQEEAIDKLVYEADPGISIDDDGVYDDDERRRDRIAIIAVLIIIGLIIIIAITSYLYLVQRRARRNRTMIVVTEALETVT